jgi:cytoplasmic iron level regulating protein YaaA (DUF328/UPF0246 family)
MLAILSPAKRLNLKKSVIQSEFTVPSYLEQAQAVITQLRKLSPDMLMRLMKISESLAHLNYERYQKWQLPFTNENAKPAIYTFAGDAYRALNVSSWAKEDLEFAASRLRILSGLYGILRPMDLIQAYRMEMGIGLSIGEAKNLYVFWSAIITNHINMLLEQDHYPVLLNLASKEYFDVLDLKHLKYPVLNFQFKEYKDGEYRFFSMYGKYARGLMVRFMVKNKIQNHEELKYFDWDNYLFNEALSTKTNWVFTRDFRN